MAEHTLQTVVRVKAPTGHTLVGVIGRTGYSRLVCRDSSIKYYAWDIFQPVGTRRSVQSKDLPDFTKAEIADTKEIGKAKKHAEKLAKRQALYLERKAERKAKRAARIKSDPILSLNISDRRAVKHYRGVCGCQFTGCKCKALKLGMVKAKHFGNGKRVDKYLSKIGRTDLIGKV